MRKFFTLLATLLLLSSPALVVADSADSAEPVVNEPVPHPILSSDGGWAGAAMIIVFFLFASAAVIGLLTYSLAAEQMPELHEQEEHDPRHASQHEPGHGHGH